MSNIKITLLVVVAIITINLASAESPTRKKDRVESNRIEFSKVFNEAQSALDAGDYEKAKLILDRLDSELNINSHGEPREFYIYLSQGNIVEAEKAAKELLLREDISDMDRAMIHKSLGDAYLNKDNLDGALIEYKKILDLRQD